jgi:hypothetical protein
VVHDRDIAEKWTKQGFSVVPVESLERTDGKQSPKPLGYVSAACIDMVRRGNWGKLQSEPTTISKTPVFLFAPQPDEVDEQTLQAVVDSLNTDEAGKCMAGAAVRAYLTARARARDASKE